ncbi:MAG: patatin-like phospholipase family protein [Candidatus Omnitrophica bacterium]|nr:patatin-like phospholipase family protein [Candidatus Omnitrophota bacterium]
MAFRVGLALGGGGVKGFAHIGALKVLRAASVPVDLVVGTSMGAVVGAYFSSNPDNAQLEDRLLKLTEHPALKRIESFFGSISGKDEPKFLIKKFLDGIKNLYLWNLQITKKYLIPSESIFEAFDELFKETQFRDLKIPFTCVATDIKSGKSVTINKGRIVDAVAASCAMPGVFAPLDNNDQLLVDGGVLSLVPVKEIKDLGADFIIAINLAGEFHCRKEELNSGLDLILEADKIRGSYINKLNLASCDWAIQPDLNNVRWWQFSKARYCIEQGEAAALRNIDNIKRALKRKKFRYFWKLPLRLFQYRRPR